MMKNTKKAFTLVELIVVITILAILGTIAFISLQGYSQDAKNTKVTSDVWQLIAAIETKTAANNWIALGDTIETNAAYEITNWASSSNQVNSWTTVYNTWTFVYHAGTINYAKLWIKPEDFKFNWKGTAWAKSYVWAYVVDKSFVKYEVAGNILDRAGNDTVVLKGTYFPVATTDVAGLISKKDDATTIATNGSANNLY